MENATKALLIAAVVLIVIVIIALGVRLIGTTKQTSTQMDTVKSEVNVATKATADGLKDSLSKLNESDEVQRFNAQFNSYIKNNLSGAKINDLINIIIKSNNNNEHKVSVEVGPIGKQEYGQQNYSGEEIKDLQGIFEKDIPYYVLVNKEEEGYISELYIDEPQDYDIFNDQFNPYIKNNLSGTKVNELINIIIKSNRENSKHKISVWIGSIRQQEYGQQIYYENDINILKNVFDSSDTFNIKINKKENLYISQLYIE